MSNLAAPTPGDPGATNGPTLSRRLKVTVIMPAFNEADSIDKTMASILGQTRVPDEVVVADGGSRDGTPELLRKYAGGGVPIKVVSNPGVYSGAGRNAATRAASHDILIGMDFSNEADPRYVEALARAFEQDPDVDYIGGPAYPIMNSPIERACAAIICPDLTRLPHVPLDELMRSAPKDFIPGGFNLAYRRRIWDKANGFLDSVGCCEDPLYGQRVRKIGGKIAPVGDAVVRYHMARSVGEMWRRYGRYARWAARLGESRRLFWRMLVMYLLGLALLAASAIQPMLALALPVALAVYFYMAAWRKCDFVGHYTGQPFTFKERAWAILLRFVYDAATLRGNLLGYLDLLRTPRWRHCRKAYLESGEQIDPLGRFSAASGQYT